MTIQPGAPVRNQAVCPKCDYALGPFDATCPRCARFGLDAQFEFISKIPRKRQSGLAAVVGLIILGASVPVGAIYWQKVLYQDVHGPSVPPSQPPPPNVPTAVQTTPAAPPAPPPELARLVSAIDEEHRRYMAARADSITGQTEIDKLTAEFELIKETQGGKAAADRMRAPDVGIAYERTAKASERAATAIEEILRLMDRVEALRGWDTFYERYRTPDGLTLYRSLPVTRSIAR